MKKRNVILSVLLVLVAATAIYVGSTYAKYISAWTGKAAVEVADWKVSVAGHEFTDNTAVTNGTVNCTFIPETTDDIVAGMVAPGRSCYFDVVIDPTDTEVAIDYSVSMGTITGKPTNMTSAVTASTGATYNADNAVTMTKVDSTYSGTIELPGEGTTKSKMTAAQAITLRYALTWPYETTDGDGADTTDGIAAASLEVPVTVTLTQRAVN